MKNKLIPMRKLKFNFFPLRKKTPNLVPFDF